MIYSSHDYYLVGSCYRQGNAVRPSASIPNQNPNPNPKQLKDRYLSVATKS